MSPPEARTLDPTDFKNSLLTTELCRMIVKKGCFDGYVKNLRQSFRNISAQPRKMDSTKG